MHDLWGCNLLVKVAYDLFPLHSIPQDFKRLTGDNTSRGRCDAKKSWCENYWDFVSWIEEGSSSLKVKKSLKVSWNTRLSNKHPVYLCSFRLILKEKKLRSVWSLCVRHVMQTFFSIFLLNFYISKRFACISFRIFHLSSFLLSWCQTCTSFIPGKT